MKSRICSSLCRTVQPPPEFPFFFPPLLFFFFFRPCFRASLTPATAVIAIAPIAPRAVRRERQSAIRRNAVSNDSGDMPTPTLASGHTLSVVAAVTGRWRGTTEVYPFTVGSRSELHDHRQNHGSLLGLSEQRSGGDPFGLGD